MNKILLVLAAVIISGCGSNSTESITEPDSFAPVVIEPTVVETPTQVVVDVPAEVEPEAPVIIIEEEPVTPVVPKPEPVTPSPVTVQPPTVVVDNSFVEDTNTIIRYLDAEARSALNVVNQTAFVSGTSSMLVRLCLPAGFNDERFEAQTVIDCQDLLYLTTLGDLVTVVAAGDFLCISTLESEYDSRNCEIDSTEQVLNAEYEITLQRDGDNIFLYIIDINADLSDDLCIVATAEGSSECPDVLADMADIITSAGY